MTQNIFGTMKSAFRFLHTTRTCHRRDFVVRRPVRILNAPSSEYNVPSLQNVNNTSKSVIVTPKKVESKEVPAIIPKSVDNVVPYEKLQKNDARFTKTLALIKNRKRREESGKILLEGKRLINDAIEAGMQMKTLYFSREEDLADIKLKNPEKVEVLKVLYQTLKVWSGLKTCPGVMAVFKRPSPDDLHVLTQSTIPVTILCDNIREPGNLGSIIRNAAAAGCENILLTKGCVDPWETKVLRAGSGGHFRIPIVNNIEWSQISNYIPSSATILIADSSPFTEEICLTSDVITFDEPKEDGEEEVTRYISYNEHNQPIHVDESFDSKEELEKYEDIQLPNYIYSRAKYPKKDIVLYVGGETHGISREVIKIACEYGGKKIKIPMENGMDSLNSAFAMTIILFEIKQRFSQSYITK